MQLCGLSLRELLARLASFDFDIALILSHGLFGPDLSLWFSLASLAMVACDEAGQRRVRDVAAAVLAAPEDPAALAGLIAEVYRQVPAVPLFRFKSGYLATPDLPDVPLVNGCIYPLEILATMVPDRGGV